MLAPRTTIAAVAIVGVLISAIAAGGGGVRAAEDSPACSPANARTVVENASVRVLRYSKHDPSYGGGAVSCELATGNTIELDDPLEGDIMFSRPAIAVAGSTVAYGASVNNADGESSTYVRVINARDSYSSAREFETQLKVGSVVARERGAVAWISCEVRFDDSPPASRSPECTRTGAAIDRVYRASGGGRPRLLDKGRNIDPESLKLTGDRLTWRAGGRTRAARLR
jgi:hypothetical protein